MHVKDNNYLKLSTGSSNLFFFLKEKKNKNKKNSRLLGMVCFLLTRPLRSLPTGGSAELLCLFSHIKEQREGVQPLSNP